jgi:hypothetical protein
MPTIVKSSKKIGHDKDRKHDPGRISSSEDDGQDGYGYHGHTTYANLGHPDEESNQSEKQPLLQRKFVRGNG